MSDEASFSVKGISFENGPAARVHFEIVLFGQGASIDVPVQVVPGNDGLLDIRRAVSDAIASAVGQLVTVYNEASELQDFPERWFPSSP